MLPWPASIMWGAASWLMMNADVTHQSNVWRKSSSVMSRKRRVCRAADIVDEDVDAAELLHGGRYDAFAVGSADGVGDDRQPLAAGLLDTLDRSHDVRLGAGGADDGCARLGEHSRDALADTLSGAGDDRDLTIQLELLQCHTGPLHRVLII